jgi:hypothetical protein
LSFCDNAVRELRCAIHDFQEKAGMSKLPAFLLQLVPRQEEAQDEIHLLEVRDFPQETLSSEARTYANED